jgi:exodeoxyribonuclease VII large subunit
MRQVENLTGQRTRQVQRELALRRQRLEGLLNSRVMREPQSMLAERRQRLDFLLAGLQRTAKAELQSKQHKLGLILNRLAAIHPAAGMGRGYGIVTKQDKLVSSIQTVEIDDELQLTFTDGYVQAKVLAKIGKGDG